MKLCHIGLERHVGEVAGSICPGSHDVSVAGRRAAGLSQRRRRHFALVHAFLLVEGTGKRREEQAMTFYALAGTPEQDKVAPDTMAALCEL